KSMVYAQANFGNLACSSRRNRAIPRRSGRRGRLHAIAVEDLVELKGEGAEGRMPNAIERAIETDFFDGQDAGALLAGAPTEISRQPVARRPPPCRAPVEMALGPRRRLRVHDHERRG